MVRIDAVIVDPDGSARKVEIDRDLTAFQNVVGGYVEGVFGDNCTIYVNEEGLIMSLPYNRAATQFVNRFVSAGYALYGTALIVGPADGDGYDTDVHESVVSYYQLEN